MAILLNLVKNDRVVNYFLAVRFNEAIIWCVRVNGRVRVSVEDRVRVSKLLGSKWNPTLTIILP